MIYINFYKNSIPNQGFCKSHFRELYPTSGKCIPYQGFYYIPFLGIISRKRDFIISHFREPYPKYGNQTYPILGLIYPKYGIYKPSGLLQDTHFVCTNCKSCQGIPLRPLVYQNWYMQNTGFGTHIPEMVYINLGKIPILVYEK